MDIGTQRIHIFYKMEKINNQNWVNNINTFEFVGFLFSIFFFFSYIVANWNEIGGG